MRIWQVWTSDIVLKINPPTLDEAVLLGGRTIISLMAPRQNEDLLAQFAQQVSVGAATGHHHRALTPPLLPTSLLH